MNVWVIAFAAMLTESCAIYAVKLLVIRLWATRNPITNFFGSILLSEARVCDLSRPPSSDALSNLARDWTVHHSTVHHPTSSQKERIDERHRRPLARQFVQRYVVILVPRRPPRFRPTSSMLTFVLYISFTRRQRCSAPFLPTTKKTPLSSLSCPSLYSVLTAIAAFHTC